MSLTAITQNLKENNTQLFKKKYEYKYHSIKLEIESKMHNLFQTILQDIMYFIDSIDQFNQEV